MEAEAVAELAPGDELVEERLGGAPGTPPAIARAGRARCEPRWIPVDGAPHAADDVVCADVAEVEVRRQAARHVGVGMVAVLAVAMQAARDELRGAPVAGRRAAADRSRRD